MEQQRVVFIFWSVYVHTKFINVLHLVEHHCDEEEPGVLERFSWRKPEFDIWLGIDENVYHPEQAWEWHHLQNTLNKVPDPKRIVLIKPHTVFMLSNDVPDQWIKGVNASQTSDVLGGVSEEEHRRLNRYIFRTPRVYIREMAQFVIPLSVLLNTHNPEPPRTRRTAMSESQLKRLRADQVEAPQETKRSKEDNTCKICLEHAQDTACIPCGHVCMCIKCAVEIKERDALGDCPMCRVEIKDLQRITLC